MSRGTIEAAMQESAPDRGWREDWHTSLGDWTVAAGTILTATSVPNIKAIATNLLGIEYAAADDIAEFAAYSFVMPRSYAQYQDDLQVEVVARKVGGTDNTDLCMEANIHWFEPGTLNSPNTQSSTGTVPTLTAGDAAKSVLTTGARALMAALGAGTNADTVDFAVYILDIGARLVAESRRIPAGAPCTIAVAPHEAIGVTTLEFFPPTIRWRRHAGLRKHPDQSWDPRTI